MSQRAHENAQAQHDRVEVPRNERAARQISQYPLWLECGRLKSVGKCVGEDDGFDGQPSHGAPQSGRPSDGSDYGLVPFDADDLSAVPKSSNLVTVWQLASTTPSGGRGCSGRAGSGYNFGLLGLVRFSLHARDHNWLAITSVIDSINGTST